jgi:outer membrane protein OmpA-like peptidoglycan-associated protein
MITRSKVLTATVLIGTTLISLSLGGCQLLPNRQQPGRHLVAPSGRPAVLTVLLGTPSPRVSADFKNLVNSTARPGLRLVVLSAANGATLGSFAAPPAPVMTGPPFPKLPPSNATSFTKAGYRKKLKQAKAELRHDVAMLLRKQRAEITAWADHAVAVSLTAATRLGHRPATARADSLAQVIAEAAAEVTALQQTKLVFGTRKVIAILADVGAAPTQLHVSLFGMTLAVADVPNAAQDAAWQADLLDAGARSTYAFTPVTDSLLAGEVGAALGGRGAVIFQLARLRYGPDQYTFPVSADHALEQALRLLTVTYPGASATINGYTDNVAVRGGNLLLSWKRAQVVLNWLVAHGVAADRLQATGHGSADPVAPNRPGGQPLNRRVVLIISTGEAA